MRWGTANIFLKFRTRRKRTGVVGSIYKTLARIGTVTRSSPVRRLIQVVCLAVFLDLFFRVCWPYASQFSASTFSDKEYLPAHWFLMIDPLVGVSTALAGKILNWQTFAWTLGILGFCILIPRAFCGYFCPLGTLIDTFDWLIGRHLKKWHVPDNPTGLQKPRWWVHTKYYLLTAILVSSLFGVLSSGLFSAIPVLTRGLLFSGGYGQLAVLKGQNNVPPVGPMFYVSLVLFVGVFLLSLKGRRFWCRYVCPSGALLSVFNTFRVGERKVESTCINCNLCVEACPFDAIEEDFTTRELDCTYCQSCGGVCPTDAIKFVTRWNTVELKVDGDPPVEPRPMSRRGFLSAGVAGAATSAACVIPTTVAPENGPRPLRPPGSVPEPDFLNLCISCGECFKVCPGPVLQPAGLEHGFEGLWKPVAVPEHAGCHQECNFCTQVCPTGAIQPLELAVKREVHMGLAKVNTTTCLPYDNENREDCDLCYVECEQAGYHAIEMVPLELPVDRMELEMAGFSDGEIDSMSTILAPVVDPQKCVGCGICTYRCHQSYVVHSDRLQENAIPVVAENEHRFVSFPTDPQDLGSPTT